MAAENRADIADDDVVAALRRVGAAAAFARSPQLRRLLEYLVTCALARKPNLKAYTIGVEALGRPDSFDPEQDTIVRVQATRLRRALETYYESDGGDDPIRIRLPTGSYLPAFERQQTAAAAIPAPVRSRRLRPVVAGIAVLLIVAAGLLSVFGPAPARLLGIRIAAPQHGNGLPTVVIWPFVFQGAPDAPAIQRYGLRRFIAGAFAKFETVNTVYFPRSDQPRSAGSSSVADQVRYDLTTFVTSDGDRTQLQFQLSDHTDDTIVWTRSFDVAKDRGLAATQKMIVRALTTTLLQPYGVIATREFAKHRATRSGDPRYRCVLQAMEALRTTSEPAYAGTLPCLESTIRTDPGYSLAYYYLASIYNRYFEYGLDTVPGAQPMLEKAMGAARRAVETNPASARGRYAVFLTYFNLRDFAAADAAMTKARELNEFDLLMLGQYGGHLIAQGRIDDGMAILDSIDDTMVSSTCTYAFFGFLGRYLRGDLAEASRRVSQLTCQSYPYTFVARALVAGDVAAAKPSIDALRALLPIWRTNPREALARMFPNADIADRLMRDLAAAGLPPAAPQ